VDHQPLPRLVRTRCTRSTLLAVINVSIPARAAIHRGDELRDALRASVALYRQLRGDALVRRTSAEAASLDYLAQVESAGRSSEPGPKLA
jgi:hypothetical protein